MPKPASRQDQLSLLATPLLRHEEFMKFSPRFAGLTVLGLFNPNRNIIKHYKKITATILAVISTVCMQSCETPEGARVLQSMLPTFTVSGTGMGRKTYKVPLSALMSKRLNFQDAVLKGDIYNAQRFGSSAFANIHIKGYPPVYYAAVRGDLDMIRLLARLGATLQYRNNGQSLVYIASSYGHSNTARVLVEMGAGNTSDVARGSLLYAANEAQRRRNAKVATGVAVAFIQAMMSGNGTNSLGEDLTSDGRTQHEANLDYEAQKLNDPSYR